MTIDEELATYDFAIELSNLGVFLVGPSITCEVAHFSVVMCRETALEGMNAVLSGCADDNDHCHVPWIRLMDARGLCRPQVVVDGSG